MATTALHCRFQEGTIPRGLSQFSQFQLSMWHFTAFSQRSDVLTRFDRSFFGIVWDRGHACEHHGRRADERWADVPDLFSDATYPFFNLCLAVEWCKGDVSPWPRSKEAIFDGGRYFSKWAVKLRLGMLFAILTCSECLCFLGGGGEAESEKGKGIGLGLDICVATKSIS